MAIQYILRGEEQIKKIKKKKKRRNQNEFVSGRRSFLVGWLGRDRFGLARKQKTNFAIAAHNKPLQTINFIIRGEWNQKQQQIYACDRRISIESECNCPILSRFFFVATPTFGFYNSRIFCFEFIKWYFSLGWMGCLIKLMMIWFCGFRSAYKSSIVPCASWWIVWFRSVNVLGYANLIKGTINKLPRKNALSLCPKTIKNGIFQFLVSIRRPNFVVRKDNFLYGQIIYD